MSVAVIDAGARDRLLRGLTLLLRVGLGGLFVVAGVLKLREPGGFAQDISNYRFLPELAPYLAMTLPGIEIVAGLALLGAPLAWRRASALAIAGLLAIFTVAVVSAVARGLNIECACFGGSSGTVTWLTVLRDLALLAAAGALLALERPRTGN